MYSLVGHMDTSPSGTESTKKSCDENRFQQTYETMATISALCVKPRRQSLKVMVLGHVNDARTS